MLIRVLERNVKMSSPAGIPHHHSVGLVVITLLQRKGLINFLTLVVGTSKPC